MNTRARERLILALDGLSLKECVDMVHKTKSHIATFKVGLGLFTQFGPRAVQELMALGVDVFLDLKLHDIPMQVASAVSRAADLGVRFLTVHGAGGEAMLKKASEAAHRSSGQQQMKLLAVSVLTHFSEPEWMAVSGGHSIVESVGRFLTAAKEANIDGCVCSPHEAVSVKATFGSHFAVVCPGVRLPSDALHDQSRVMTPQLALQQGADFLVIGRPITESSDPETQAFLFHQAAEQVVGISSQQQEGIEIG